MQLVFYIVRRKNNHENDISAEDKAEKERAWI